MVYFLGTFDKKLMKNILISIALGLAFSSCQSEGELTQTDIGAVPLPAEARLLYEGTFSPTSGIQVAGTARVYDQDAQRYVSLEAFSISRGPDLKVYLATSASPDTFVSLGALGNGEDHTYTIPEGVDLTVYDHVLIHCQQYNHLFAIAPLQPAE